MTAREPKRRRPGASWFYEEAVSEAERHQLPAAQNVEGIDDEIALLRLRLKSALSDGEVELRLILQGMETLRRLVATRYALPKADKAALDAQSRELREEFTAMVGGDEQHA